jgi:biotin carboxyl carrier protein
MEMEPDLVLNWIDSKKNLWKYLESKNLQIQKTNVKTRSEVPSKTTTTQPQKKKKTPKEVKSEIEGSFWNQELDNTNLDVKDGNELLMEKVCKKPRFWSSLQLPFARRTIIVDSTLAST